MSNVFIKYNLSDFIFNFTNWNLILKNLCFFIVIFLKHQHKIKENLLI